MDRTEAGRALLYTLNREHVAAPAVELLSGMRSEFMRRLVAAVDAWVELSHRQPGAEEEEGSAEFGAKQG